MTLTSRISKEINFDDYCIKELNSNQNRTIFNFFHPKAYGTKFDLAIRQVKVNSGSSFT